MIQWDRVCHVLGAILVLPIVLLFLWRMRQAKKALDHEHCARYNAEKHIMKLQRAKQELVEEVYGLRLEVDNAVTRMKNKERMAEGRALNSEYLYPAAYNTYRIIGTHVKG